MTAPQTRRAFKSMVVAFAGFFAVANKLQIEQSPMSRIGNVPERARAMRWAWSSGMSLEAHPHPSAKHRSGHST